MVALFDNNDEAVSTVVPETETEAVVADDSLEREESSPLLLTLAAAEALDSSEADEIVDVDADTNEDPETGADSECGGQSKAVCADDSLALAVPDRLSCGLADVEALA